MKRKLIRTSKNLEKIIWDKVLEEFSKVKSLKDIDVLFNNLLTANERENVARRLAILALTKQGVSYRLISQQLWVAPATISAIRKSFFKNGRYITRLEFEREKNLLKPANPTKEVDDFSRWLDYLAFTIATLPKKSGPRWNFLTYNPTLPKKYWKNL